MAMDARRCAPSASKGREHLEHHEGWPENALEEREQVHTERVCLLPVEHERSEDAQPVDRTSAGGTCSVGTHDQTPVVGGPTLLDGA